MDDRRDTLGDLRRGVAAALRRGREIVGADVDHDGLGGQAVQLAQLDALQHVLRAVPAETQVQGGMRAEERLPRLRAAVARFPAVGGPPQKCVIESPMSTYSGLSWAFTAITAACRASQL